MKEKFSFDTIKDFDKHIECSIPNYSHLFDLISSMSTYFIEKDTNVYDLGCSTGLLLKNLSTINKIDNVNFIGYEISDNLKPSQTVGFNWIKQDLTKQLSIDNTNLIFSIFTLQFLKISDRKQLIKKVYNSLNDKGAFIVAEKTYHTNGFIQDLFTFSYYDYKSEEFSNDEIMQKQKDLRSIMKPITERENIEIFNDAGFHVSKFFQSLQFNAWILIK